MNPIRHPLAAVAALMVLASSTAAAQGSEVKECSAATLSGSYLFTASGWGAPAGTWLPKAIVEYIHLNGDGTLTVLAATVANPAGNGAVVEFPAGGSGIYSLDPSCNGTLVFTNGPSFIIVAAAKGDDFWMIQTNANNVLQGKVTRLAR
jgi:hypothetical protein